MTIAAGFRFETGILLCADTQYTSASKTKETKIFPIKHHAATLICVLTGRQMYAKRAIEQIAQRIKSLPEDQLTRGRMQDEIEGAMRHIFNNDVYAHPDWGKQSSPDFSFVIGLYSPIDGDFLLATEETLAAEMTDHVCLGSGSYLGDYLSRMYLGRNQRLKDIVSLATYILYEAKSYDAGCGGDSEFIVLWDDGDTSQIEAHDVGLAESYSWVFSKAVSQLFHAVSDLDSTDDQGIDTAIKILKDNREVRRKGRKAYDDLIISLGRKLGEHGVRLHGLL